MRPCAGGDGLHRSALVTISNWFHGNRSTQSQSSSSWVSSMRRSENWLGGWTLTRSIPLVTESIPFTGPFILCWIGADDLEWSLYYDKKKKKPWSKNGSVHWPRRWCYCCWFCSVLLFFSPLVYRQHHYLTYVFKRLVNRESSGIFNIYDVTVWFLDNILLCIW